jgi:hypothetical protein
MIKLTSMINGGRGNRGTTNRRRTMCSAESLESRTLFAALTIAQENALPGNPNSEWDIFGAGDTSLQGFATDISVNQGGTVSFKIDDRSAAAYHLDIYRMGYYGGMGARKVASVPSSQTLRQVQPAPLKNAATGLVDCGNWAVSASWAVPADATSGIYFAKAIRDDTGGSSHIVFVVRNDTSHSDILFQTSDTTWQAYNDYGGNSLYVGTAPTSDGRAYKVSYNRPFNTRAQGGGGGSSNWVFHAEYPMVRFMEQNGYDVSYSTDLDADRRGAELLEHKTYMTAGHDEYWSGGQRANLEAARNAGVNLAFFAGNDVFWKVRWENSIDGSGTPYRTLVCYKETKSGAKIDPSPEWTGTWRDPTVSPPSDGGRPENALTGTIFTVNRGPGGERGTAINVPAADGKMRFWRNTIVNSQASGATATIGDGVLGYEWNEDLDNGFRPGGLIRLSTTTQNVPEHIQDYGNTYAAESATHSLTLYRAASGALVFSAGTVQYSWGLDGANDAGGSTPSLPMQQATINLFADMGVQPATLKPGLVAATASADSVAPTSVITSPANGITVQKGVAVTVTGTATDAGGGLVGGVEVSTDGGATWHRATGRESWSYVWTATSSGVANIRSRATDDSARTETPGPGVTVTVPAPTPVLALGFDDGAGTTAVDSSGRGNTGTLGGGPVWSTAGKYGKALIFDGVNDWVTVADANSLDLTTAMTLEAWVRPAANSTDWSCAILKERSGGLAYSLYTSDGAAKPPATYVSVNGGDNAAVGASILPANSWSHLAGTYDGVTLRTYVNGNLVGSRVVGGAAATSTAPLRIGGNSVWGEWFNGMIDEVRVYATALSQSEIQADMNSPVSGPADGVAPTVSVTAPAAGATVSATATLTASASDNVGVAGVQFKVNGAAVGAEDTAAPYSFAWDTTTFANGAYTVTAVARDAAGNATTSAGVAVTVSNADVTPPTLTGRTPAPGAAGVAVNVAPTATFSEAVTAATISFVLTDSGGSTVPSTTSYNAATRTATLTPAAPLASLTTYTATVGSAQDATGNTMAASSWSFTTVLVDTVAPTVTAQTPSPGATGVGSSSNVTATFSEDVQSATIAFVLRDALSAVVQTSFAYNAATRTATLTPSAALAATATYTATVSGAKDLAGNTMAGPATWSFTTAAAPPPPPPGVTINDVTVTEGNTGTVNAVFTVTLSAASAQAVSVNWSTANGTATAGSDYAAGSGTLTIPAGATSGTITVAVTGDTAVEANETFLVNLAAPVNATLTDAQGQGTITNDDAATGGLVAAYGFEEGTGTAAADSSGTGNNGVLNGPAWTAAGKFGGALSFDGVNDWVTIADANSLDLSSRLTLEAWIRPTSIADWSSVILKERGTGGLAYSLYAADGANRPPSAYIYRSRDVAAVGTAALPPNAWSHLAATYDGANVRLYVNGALAATTAITGNIAATTNPLRIGGNAVWGEFFSGLIDEVRVYNRALSLAEVQADMGVPVVPPPAGAAPAMLLAAVAPAPASTTTTTSATQSILSDGEAGDNARLRALGRRRLALRRLITLADAGAVRAAAATRTGR